MAVLFGAHNAFNDGANGFQMRRIGREVDVDAFSEDVFLSEVNPKWYLPSPSKYSWS
jgi:hypothetical protein